MSAWRSVGLESRKRHAAMLSGPEPVFAFFTALTLGTQ
jgi:hypothetical protein